MKFAIVFFIAFMFTLGLIYLWHILFDDYVNKK
jgi:hypothetical protein